MHPSNRDLGRVPLVLAYGAGPLLALFRHGGLDPHLAELAGRGLWLAMAGLGLALACSGRSLRPSRAHALGLAAGLVLALILVVVAVFLYLQPTLFPGIFPGWSGLLQGPVVRAWLNEAAPLAWVGLAALWALFVAVPRREDFLWAGSGLALLVLLDFFMASLWSGRPLFSGGFFFDQDLVRVESHATLLLVAHVVGFGLDGERTGPDRTRVLILRRVVLAGLLATFSRSALLAGVVLALALDPAPLKERFSTALGCAVCALLPIFFPDAPALVMDRFEARLEWISGVQWLLEKPFQLFSGYNPADLMDMRLPVPVGNLLLPDETLRLEASSIGSGWLRILLIWGVWGWMALAAGAALLFPGCPSGRRRALLGLVLGVMLQGMFFAPLHHPGPAVALVLGLWAVRRPAMLGQ